MENSLQQYLDLYSDHKDLLCSKSVEGFNRLRREAYENLKTTGLPRKGSENYELTDLQSMLAPNYGLNIARIPLDVNPSEGFRCGLPHLTSCLFFFLNDRFAESKGARINLPEGVEVGPLSAYLQKDEDASKFYGKVADLSNPLVALNTMLVQEGFFLKVKKGVKVEKPLQLVALLENTMPLMAVRRLLIILEEDAEVKLVSCSHNSSRSIEMASSAVVEIIAGKNSRLQYYDLEENGGFTNRLMSLYSRQEAGSEVLLESFTLHNGNTRNEFNCSLNGEHADLKVYGMGIEGGESLLDNYSHISHCEKNCHTEELFKYIVDNRGQGAFTGRIYVAPGASKTEAYQSNRNLISGNEARVFSKPQLEIYNDDVKCSHGSATGKLDEMQLFYLRSRGLSNEEAHLLLKQAFMADVVDGVQLSLLRDRLHNIIERRLLGDNRSCDDCDICNNMSEI